MIINDAELDPDPAVCFVFHDRAAFEDASRSAQALDDGFLAKALEGADAEELGLAREAVDYYLVILWDIFVPVDLLHRVKELVEGLCLERSDFKKYALTATGPHIYGCDIVGPAFIGNGEGDDAVPDRYIFLIIADSQKVFLDERFEAEKCRNYYIHGV